MLNLEDKFACFSEYWSPKILVRLNDCHVNAAKLLGQFVWPEHEETDELFLVTKGTLVIRFRDRACECRGGRAPGVSKGIGHKPVAEEECEMLLIEPGQDASGDPHRAARVDLSRGAPDGLAKPDGSTRGAPRGHREEHDRDRRGRPSATGRVCRPPLRARSNIDGHRSAKQQHAAVGSAPASRKIAEAGQATVLTWVKPIRKRR